MIAILAPSLRFFYAQVFKRYRKVCRRIHFFSSRFPGLLHNLLHTSLTEKLEGVDFKQNYLGFIVVRPLEHAPIGRTVLKPPPSVGDLRSHVLVRATYQAHLLGIELEITGAPFIQQDARVGACAHATIWMAGRHFHAKHRAPWYSVAEIADAAMVPTDALLAQSLPAGSGGLGLNNMVRALRAMGAEPLLYAGQIDRANNSATWPSSLRPEDIINRYTDSGIPVILCLLPLSAGQDGHAVLCVGHVLKTISSADITRPRTNAAVFCDAFLVNDDQRGCQLAMPIDLRSTKAPTSYPYSVRKHVYCVIVPLPKKVFIKGEMAELLAWDFVDFYRKEWPSLKIAHAAKISNSIANGDRFCHAIDNNQVISRTYLTFGWRYKERLLNNICNNKIKAMIIPQSLPRFIWVTEFGIFDELNCSGPLQIRILGHSVVDATSSEFWDALLVFHGPRFL